MINSGYKNMPEATANAWRNGWFHTGDELMQDEEGNFYFLDRKKDVIRRRAVNISSFEVEAEVISHPLVKDVAAIAVKNPDLEQAAGDEEVKVVRRARAGRGARPRGARSTTSPGGCRATGSRATSSTWRSCRERSRTRSRRASCATPESTPQTWDREKAGIKFKREVLT